MLIGYARVSTDDQNLDLQRDALRLAGCEKIYEDLISGAKAARPGLALALEVARAGDVLTVWRLDRLGRSLHDLILLGRKLDEMGIGLMSVQEKIDTSSSGGRLVFHMFGALAEFERNLVRERKKPIVLMVNEAHDLHHHTLTGLKRLIEMVADGDGKLCVLLAGHPKLRRDLRNPTMEEIGYRTAVFSLEGVTGSQREYIEWMLATCAADKAKVDAIFDPAAVDLLASRLRTPLQIEQHLTLALETGYQASEKPVGEAIVDSVLSKQINDLETTLTRHGYTEKE